jgi:hypothetical protein
MSQLQILSLLISGLGLRTLFCCKKVLFVDSLLLSENFDTLLRNVSCQVQATASGYKHDKPSRKLNIKWFSHQRCAFEAHSSTVKGAIAFA